METTMLDLARNVKELQEAISTLEMNLNHVGVKVNMLMIKSLNPAKYNMGDVITINDIDYVIAWPKQPYPFKDYIYDTDSCNSSIIVMDSGQPVRYYCIKIKNDSLMGSHAYISEYELIDQSDTKQS